LNVGGHVGVSPGASEDLAGRGDHVDGHVLEGSDAWGLKQATGLQSKLLPVPSERNDELLAHAL
jgi:hypothetical protein